MSVAQTVVIPGLTRDLLSRAVLLAKICSLLCVFTGECMILNVTLPYVMLEEHLYSSCVFIAFIAFRPPSGVTNVVCTISHLFSGEKRSKNAVAIK